MKIYKGRFQEKKDYWNFGKKAKKTTSEKIIRQGDILTRHTFIES